MSDVIGSYPCGRCGRSVQSGKRCGYTRDETDKETVRRIFAKPEPASTEEMIAEHNFATREVSRAEFEGLESRVEATIACLWAMHSPCDVRESRYVKCPACQAIRDLQAGVGYGA